MVDEYLRDIKPEDLPEIFSWRNDPEIRRYMYAQEPIPWHQHVAWFERSSIDPGHHVKILIREEKPCAFVQFREDKVARRAEWGFYAAPTADRGTGGLLGKLALRYAFKDLSIHKLCGEALAYNARSIQFHEKLGFRNEGCRREHYFDGKHFHDVYIYGLLSAEYSQNEGAGKS